MSASGGFLLNMSNCRQESLLWIQLKCNRCSRWKRPKLTETWLKCRFKMKNQNCEAHKYRAAEILCGYKTRSRMRSRPWALWWASCCWNRNVKGGQTSHGDPGSLLLIIMTCLLVCGQRKVTRAKPRYLVVRWKHRYGWQHRRQTGCNPSSLLGDSLVAVTFPPLDWGIRKQFCFFAAPVFNKVSPPAGLRLLFSL